MARRSGQSGYIELKGNWYHVRFRIDTPGQEKRPYKSVKICPKSGPGKMTKPERERRAREIVDEYGANSEEHFNQVEAINLGITFGPQAERWLNESQSRKRKPVKPNTVSHWRSILDKWLLPEFKGTPLSVIDNPQGKALVAKLADAGLSANSIRCIMNVLKSVVASVLDGKGNQVYPRQWSNRYMDTPIVGDGLNTPTLTRDEVNKIIRATEGREQILYIVLAASGMRIGETMGLDVEQVVDEYTTLQVRHSIWRSYMGAPKLNSVRDVDLAFPVAAVLRTFLNGRTSGPVFQTKTGKRESTRNALRSFHSLLNKLGMAERGFHAFRRFRISTLRADGVPGKDGVPEHLINYWTGHKDQSMNGKYDYSSKTLVHWRKCWAEKTGCGFEIPQDLGDVAPNAPKIAPGLTKAKLGGYSGECAA